jgi:hypothetical protein
MSAITATPPTAHGRRELAEERARPAAVVEEPQWWQKRAPATRAAPHDAHCAPASGDPHVEQKRPCADAPQAGQVLVSAVVTVENLRREA